jgi:hypothetical protein
MSELTTIDSNSYLTKENFEHYFRIANMMAKSEMVTKGYKDKPQDVLIAMEYGRSLGLGALQAIQNIAVINGRPSLYGDAVLAVCSGHPDFEDIKEEQILSAANKVIGYTCTVKRKNRSPVTQSFTIDDATAAGLLGRQGPWKTNQARMLQMRARAFALRDSFADALGGVRVVEEVQDYRETRNITPVNAKEELKALIYKNKMQVDKDPQFDTETGEVLPEELQ